MATPIGKRVKDIMDNEMGEFGEFILRKQCYELFMMPEELKNEDLFELSKALADAIKLFGGDEKAKKVSNKVLKLIDVKVIDDQEDMNEKIRMLRSTGDAYKTIGGWNVAIKFYKQALSIAEDNSNHKETASIYRSIGAIKRREGRWGVAQDMLKKSLSAANKSGDRDEVARTYQGIGRIHWQKSEYQKAVHYYTECIELCVQTQNKKILGYILLDLGRVYDEMGEHDQSISNLQMGLALLKEIGDEQGVAKIYNKLGCVYAHQGNLKKAFRAYDTSLKQAEVSGFMSLQALVQANAGEWFARQDDYEIAEDYCEQAMDTFKKFDDRFGLSYATMSYAILYSRQEMWRQAQEMFEECVRHREFIGTPYAIAECCLEYGLMLKAKGEKKKAIAQLRKALITFKTLRNQPMIKLIAKELKKLK
jgi:tetratricopeptide (TPR) repeat protein